MPIHLISFGFKHNPPPLTSAVLDARKIANPYRDPVLRPLDGRDRRVQRYVMRDPQADALLIHAEYLISDGNRVIAIGCTGGHHRSVALVEILADRLRDDDQEVTVEHRDLTCT